MTSLNFVIGDYLYAFIRYVLIIFSKNVVLKKKFFHDHSKIIKTYLNLIVSVTLKLI